MNLTPRTPQSEVFTPSLPENTAGFFDAISTRIEQRTHAETRLNLQKMLSEMRYQVARTAIVLGTKGEQEDFLARIETFLTNPGELTPTRLQENFQAMIAEKLSEWMTRARNLNLSLGIDLVRPPDVDFNFPMVDVNTTLVPIDLHLLFEATDSVDVALRRLSEQYRGRFNAIVLINPDKSPRGIITLQTLQEFNPATTLENVPVNRNREFPNVYTPKTSIEEQMHALGVNIYPIVDRDKNTVIGIITHENITITDTRYYTTTLKTQIAESALRRELESNPSEQEA